MTEIRVRSAREVLSVVCVSPWTGGTRGKTERSLRHTTYCTRAQPIGFSDDKFEFILVEMPPNHLLLCRCDTVLNWHSLVGGNKSCSLINPLYSGCERKKTELYTRVLRLTFVRMKRDGGRKKTCAAPALLTFLSSG